MFVISGSSLHPGFNIVRFNYIYICMMLYYYVNQLGIIKSSNKLTTQKMDYKGTFMAKRSAINTRVVYNIHIISFFQ